ncbi:MAG TPA: hypothetical protein VNI20_06410 [Fimbriimonadaceae bacterium]|nr:hypothetical protein [Fimbriimonadaceae bacterium]
MNRVVPRALRALAVFAAIAALVQTATAQVGRYAYNSIEVRLKPGCTPVDTAGLLAEGLGRVTRIDGATVTIALDQKVGLKDALTTLRKRASVAYAKSIAPEIPFELGSVRKVSVLKEAIKEYKAAYLAHESVVGKEDTESEDGDIPGLGYLESLLQYIEERAYPNDEIDYSGLLRFARRRIDEMRWKDLRIPPHGRPFIGSAASQALWEFVGPTNLNIPYRTYYGIRPINGRVNGVAVSPTDPNTIYIAPAQGGPWKTTDGGTTWTPLGDDWPLMHTSCITIDPTNANTVYVGTGDFYGYRGAGYGVMKSTDGGASWVPYGGGVMGSARVSKVVVDPDKTSIVLASTGRLGTGRLYRSTDAGVTWSALAVPAADWTDLTVGVPDGSGVRTFWAGGSGNPGYVYKSTDHGATWQAVTVPQLNVSNSVIAIATSKIDSQTAYLTAPWQQDVVLKTTDGGTTWTDVSAGLPAGYQWGQGWYDYWIGTSVYNDGVTVRDQVYLGIISTVMSTDGGTTWRDVGGYGWVPTYSSQAVLHNDQHCFTVDPSDPNTVYFGCDGGIYRFVYNPGTDSFQYTILNKNLGITQFYRIATHPTNANYLLGGTQDNASPHAYSDLANWGNPGAGDGAGCIISPFDPNVQFHSWQYQGIRWTTDGFATQHTITPNWTGQSKPFIGKLLLDPNTGTSMYANTDYMNRFDTTSGTWSLMLGGTKLSTSGRVNAMAVALGDSNRIYAGATDSELWMSTDFGSTWSRIDDSQRDGGSGLPNKAITSISVNPADENDILVSVSGTGAAHVWRCFDVTAPTPIWVSASGSGATGLPDMPVNDIERDLNSPGDTWYVGADVGVWQTTDAGSTWTDMTHAYGLPDVTIGDLEAVPQTGYLNAGTYGRGWWRISIGKSQLHLVDFAFNPSTVDGGTQATGTVTLSGIAPAGGMNISLSSSTSLATPPPSVLVPPGSSSVSFSVPVAVVINDSSTTVAASDGTNTVTATIIVKAHLQTGPWTASVVTGSHTGGDLSTLLNSDDLYYETKDASGTAETEYSAILPYSYSGGYHVEIESSATASGQTREVRAYNYTTSTWDLVESGSEPTVDSTVTFTVSGDYADPVTGEVKLRLKTFGTPLPLGFTQRVDRIRWIRP